jgi:hypothetical protein
MIVGDITGDIAGKAGRAGVPLTALTGGTMSYGCQLIADQLVGIFGNHQKHSA